MGGDWRGCCNGKYNNTGQKATDWCEIVIDDHIVVVIDVAQILVCTGIL